MGPYSAVSSTLLRKSISWKLLALDEDSAVSENCSQELTWWQTSKIVERVKQGMNRPLAKIDAGIPGAIRVVYEVTMGSLRSTVMYGIQQ